MAIIAEKGGDEKVYMIGDEVQRGLQLNAVYADRVVFRRGGRLEELRLPRADESAAAPARARTTRTPATPASASAIRRARRR